MLSKQQKNKIDKILDRFLDEYAGVLLALQYGHFLSERKKYMKETEKSLMTWNKKIDISKELYRVYHFPNGEEVRIISPLYLIVSDNGHRICDGTCVSHYIPYGWIHLWWENTDKEKFQFNHQRTGQKDG